MGKEAAECFFKEALLLRLSTYLSGITFAWDNCNWLLFELTDSLKELSEQYPLEQCELAEPNDALCDTGEHATTDDKEADN